MPGLRFIVAAISLLSLAACSSDWHPRASESPLIIEVVGTGAMKTAVDDAKAAGLFREDNEGIVKLKWEEDADSLEGAMRTARRLRNDPHVLAVVGHSRSGTTLAALPFYAQAGIPVLMPAATSPYVLHESTPGVEPAKGSDDSPRFSNAFRLTPSDVPDQANAIELLVSKLNEVANPTKPAPAAGQNELAHAPDEKHINVMLVCDVTKSTGAYVYTLPMCQALRKDPTFSKYLDVHRELELDTGDIYGLVTEIHAVKPDVLVLVAYPEMARDLLQELKERADAMPQGLAASTKARMSDYSIIVSDASFGNRNDLVEFGSQVYLTSPNKPSPCKTKEGGLLPTDEAYTFDALYILDKAVDKCKQTKSIDRGCIMDAIKNAQPLQAVCENYTIVKGERQNAAYYVYSTCSSGQQARSVRARWSVERDKKELQEIAGWCGQSNP